MTKRHDPTRLEVAYIVGQYPAVSHTFIDREVQALRKSGIAVQTISIRRPSPAHLLTDHDRSEAASTWVVLPPSPFEVVGAHLRVAVTSPKRYVATLLKALRTGLPGTKGFIRKAFYFAESVLVFDRLRRTPVRHVHAHFANSASWVAMLVAHLGGPNWQFSWTMHGPGEFDDVFAVALPEKIRAAAFVACIGDYCRSQLMRYSEPSEWDKLIIVKCGVDVDAYLHSSAPDRSGALRLLTVARMVPNKGQLILLEAAAELRRRGYHVHLTVVGDGPGRPDVERQVERLGLGACVELPGLVGQNQIPKLYELADVFVLPSFAEGVPVVLMEAMASGLPVVATRVMGVAELVEDGVSGVLVGPGNVSELSAAIASLADSPERRDAFGHAARTRVASEYALPAVVQSLVQAFRAAQ